MRFGDQTVSYNTTLRLIAIQPAYIMLYMHQKVRLNWLQIAQPFNVSQFQEFKHNFACYEIKGAPFSLKVEIDLRRDL